jgi:hypothetical protein
MARRHDPSLTGRAVPPLVEMILKDLVVLGSIVVGLTIAAAVAAVSPGVKMPLASASQSKCESAEVVATVKNVAVRKLNSGGGEYLLRFPNLFLSRSTYSYPMENMTIGSFIERNPGCSAIITMRGVDNPGYTPGRDLSAEISVDYTIETTIDGKKMVSARFRRND